MKSTERIVCLIAIIFISIAFSFADVAYSAIAESDLQKADPVQTETQINIHTGEVRVVPVESDWRAWTSSENMAANNPGNTIIINSVPNSSYQKVDFWHSRWMTRVHDSVVMKDGKLIHNKEYDVESCVVFSFSKVAAILASLIIVALIPKSMKINRWNLMPDWVFVTVLICVVTITMSAMFAITAPKSYDPICSDYLSATVLTGATLGLATVPMLTILTSGYIRNKISLLFLMFLAVCVTITLIL